MASREHFGEKNSQSGHTEPGHELSGGGTVSRFHVAPET